MLWQTEWWWMETIPLIAIKREVIILVDWSKCTIFLKVWASCRDDADAKLPGFQGIRGSFIQVILELWMRSNRLWMRCSQGWMRPSRGWMRSSQVWMSSSRVWMRSSRVWMRSSRVWMGSGGWYLAECGWDLAEDGWDLAQWLEHLAVNAKVDLSFLRHSGIWGATEVEFLNNVLVHKKKKTKRKKSLFYSLKCYQK